MRADRRAGLPGAAVLPQTLASNPRLSGWVSVTSDGMVTVRVGKVELGQGIVTALAQLAADELDVDLGRIRMIPANTADGPDEGLTAGSMSVEESGAAVQQVCAEVRARFLAEAVRQLALDPDTVTVRDGVIGDAAGTRTTTYGALADRVSLDRDADGSAHTRRVGRVVGTSAPRLDLPDKIAGRPRFIHDLVLPGQAYGRVVRPSSPAASLVAVDPASVAGLPELTSVVRDGSFLGVVAESEQAADRAATALRSAARWHERPMLPDEDDLATFLRSGPIDSFLVDRTGPTAPAERVVRRLRASYSRPFLAHASMAPSCAVARWDGPDVRVWTHSQGIFRLRQAIATALGLAQERVTVHHVEGAGCYGHNGADDAAFDAVLLARSVPGRPVHLRWSRNDELTWAPFGSAMIIDIEAGLDRAGRVASWTSDVWSQGHAARPGYAGSPGLLAAAHLDPPQWLPPPVDPPLSHGAGSARNAVPGYDFPHRYIRGHRSLRAPLVPGAGDQVAAPPQASAADHAATTAPPPAADQPDGWTLRSSALRSLGAFGNVFAIESFMDELALAAGQDPVDYRLAHLADRRARDVLTVAAELAGWGRRGHQDGVGFGVGFARYKNRGAYCTVVAEVEAVHEVRVRRLAIAVDVGRVVNPDGVRNQIEGGAVQATSWTLKERVRFDRRRVWSADWETYPILRFTEVPVVDVEIVSRPDQPSVGAGEAAQGPTAAAIANAVAHALSVRIRDLPITTGRILAALGA